MVTGPWRLLPYCGSSAQGSSLLPELCCLERASLVDPPAPPASTSRFTAYRIATYTQCLRCVGRTFPTAPEQLKERWPPGASQERQPKTPNGPVGWARHWTAESRSAGGFHQRRQAILPSLRQMIAANNVPAALDASVAGFGAYAAAPRAAAVFVDEPPCWRSPRLFRGALARRCISSIRQNYTYCVYFT